MCYHTKGGQKVKLSKAHRRTKREKEREREKERKRERDEPLLRGEQTKKLSQKKHKKPKKKKRKKKDSSLSPCVWSSLFSFLFSSFFRKKEFRNFLQRFFLKGGGGFGANYMRNFFTFARALYRATLYQRERGKDEQHQRILRGKRGK